MSRTHFFPVLLLLVFLLLFHGLAGTGRCDLQVVFLVDRSGSMWGLMDGTPKTVRVADAVTEVARDLPPDVAMGLRVYPPPPLTEGSADDPGLRIPVGTGNRDLFPEELARLNPRGRAPLAEPLRQAVHDFTGMQDGKLLILINDNADTNGHSFCDRPLFSSLPDFLQVHIFTMNLQDESEREQLDCLGSTFSGGVTHLDPGDSLQDQLRRVTRTAHREESERQARILEEKRIQEALSSKTRLEVSFRNTLDPFHADFVEIADFRINGRAVVLDPVPVAVSGERLVIFEQAVAEGFHRIDLQYRMRRGQQSITSRTGSLEVKVEEGMTARVLGVPRSALFHWGCSLEPAGP